MQATSFINTHLLPRDLPCQLSRIEHYCRTTKRPSAKSRTLITARKAPRARRPRNNGDYDKDDPWTADKLGFLEIGTILGPHGVRGEAKILYSSDFPKQRLSSSKGQRYLLLPGRRYPRPIGLKGGRKASQKSTWIIKIEGYDAPETVQELRGGRLFIKEQDRPPLSRDEFVVTDLVGLKVVLLDDDSKGAPIGSVSSVILRQDIATSNATVNPSLGSDTLEISLFNHQSVETGNSTTLEDTISFLIPFVRELVPHVNIQAKILTINPPSGLIEITKVNRTPIKFLPRGLLCAGD